MRKPSTQPYGMSPHTELILTIHETNKQNPSLAPANTFRLVEPHDERASCVLFYHQ